jgi:hypothetical protein
MAQVSNVQSRTLRVLGSLPEELKTTLSSSTILEKESNGKVKTFVTSEDISSVIKVLSTNNVVFRPHFYSLFAKFTSELKSTEVEVLNEKIYAVTPDAEISYSRIDHNGHTGKIVVDRFEDYNALRSFEGDITFYKFNRTKAQSRSKQPVKPVLSTNQVSTNQVDTEGFETVVKKSYTKAVKPSQQTATTTRGRGVSTRGRGRAPREGARTTRVTTEASKTV